MLDFFFFLSFPQTISIFQACKRKEKPSQIRQNCWSVRNANLLLLLFWCTRAGGWGGGSSSQGSSFASLQRDDCTASLCPHSSQRGLFLHFRGAQHTAHCPHWAGGLGEVTAGPSAPLNQGGANSGPGYSWALQWAHVSDCFTLLSGWMLQEHSRFQLFSWRLECVSGPSVDSFLAGTSGCRLWTNPAAPVHPGEQGAGAARGCTPSLAHSNRMLQRSHVDCQVFNGKLMDGWPQNAGSYLKGYITLPPTSVSCELPPTFLPEPLGCHLLWIWTGSSIWVWF